MRRQRPGASNLGFDLKRVFRSIHMASREMLLAKRYFEASPQHSTRSIVLGRSRVSLRARVKTHRISKNLVEQHANRGSERRSRMERDAVSN